MHCNQISTTVTLWTTMVLWNSFFV